MSEIDNVFGEYQRTKIQQQNNYIEKNHRPLKDEIIGYITDTSLENKLKSQYNVQIPTLNNIVLRSVPINIPGAFVQSNGVGYKPPTLRSGQMVTVKFLDGRTSHPIITGSFSTPGQPELWKFGVPTIDQKDSTGLNITPPPLPPEAIAAKGDAEVRVYPLLVRSSSPTQTTNSAANLEIPGNTYIEDTYGNTYTHYVGSQIISGQNQIISTEGVRESLADLPKKQALIKADRIQTEIAESLAYWRSAVGGVISLLSPHPANSIKQTVITGTTSTFNLPTGFAISSLSNSKSLEKTLRQIDSIFKLLDNANQTSLNHLSFMDKGISPVLSKLRSIWGTFDNFGSVQLQLNIPLPLNLKLSVSINFNFQTGKLIVAGNVGIDVNQSIAPIKTTVLRSEGTRIAGGYKRQIDNFLKSSNSQRNSIRFKSIQTSSIYKDYPVLIGYSPLKNTSNIPAILVSRDENNLDFATKPIDGLISLLTKFGVEIVTEPVRYLYEFITENNYYSFLKSSASLATPLIRLLILTGIGLNQDSKLNTNSNSTNTTAQDNINLESSLYTELYEILIITESPSLNDCPSIPVETRELIKLSLIRNTKEVESILKHYYFTEVPDYSSWFESPDNFIFWLKAQKHPYYPAFKQLLSGDILGFFILYVFLSTSVDIRINMQAFSFLKQYLNLVYYTPKVGAQNV